MNKRKRIRELETESAWLWQKVIESDRRYIGALRTSADRQRALEAAEAILERFAEAEYGVDADDETWLHVKVQYVDWDRLQKWALA